MARLQEEVSDEMGRDVPCAGMAGIGSPAPAGRGRGRRERRATPQRPRAADAGVLEAAGRPRRRHASGVWPDGCPQWSRFSSPLYPGSPGSRAPHPRRPAVTAVRLGFLGVFGEPLRRVEGSAPVGVREAPARCVASVAEALPRQSHPREDGRPSPRGVGEFPAPYRGLGLGKIDDLLRVRRHVAGPPVRSYATARSGSRSIRGRGTFLRKAPRSRGEVCRRGGRVALNRAGEPASSFPTKGSPFADDVDSRRRVLAPAPLLGYSRAGFPRRYPMQRT